MHETVIQQLEESADLKRAVAKTLSGKIADAAQMTMDAYDTEGKVLLIGNGGSAADAQHIASELVGRSHMEREALPAIALATDSSVSTAVANDYCYEAAFARQIEALANKNDVFLAITTSGISNNILRAVEIAGSKAA